MKISTDGPVLAAMLVFSGFIRVLRPLVRWPPPPVSEIYDAYIGLTPIASVTAMFLVSTLLQIVFVPFTLGRVSASERAMPFTVLTYAVMYTIHAPLSSDNKTGGQPSSKLVLMCACVLFWTIVTIKGMVHKQSYSHSKYRPGAVMIWHRVPTPAFIILSIQHTILRSFVTFLLALPFYPSWMRRDLDLLPHDYIVTASFVLATLTKLVADAQHSHFYESQADEAKAPRGLYRFVRHPELLADIAAWSCFAVFNIRKISSTWLWTAVGVPLYAFITIAEAGADDYALREKHHAYVQYMKRVYMLLPVQRYQPASSPAVADGNPQPSKKTQ